MPSAKKRPLPKTSEAMKWLQTLSVLLQKHRFHHTYVFLGMSKYCCFGKNRVLYSGGVFFFVCERFLIS